MQSGIVDLSPIRINRDRLSAKPETVQMPIQVGDISIPCEIANIKGYGPYFALGVRKSGSTMLYKIVNFLASKNGINAVDFPGRFFKNGLTFAQFNAIDVSQFIEPGNIYLGFRAFPEKFSVLPDFLNAPKIFMFRDPRDALVSQYFSDGYSHTLPAAKDSESAKGHELFLSKREEALNADIDEWVLRKASALRSTLTEYQNMLTDKNTLLLRYEDYVFQKERLIKKILSHFGWTITRGELDRILSIVDIVPEKEDKAQFVRRVIPGDFRVKLKNETILRLDNKLAAVLAAYDY